MRTGIGLRRPGHVRPSGYIPIPPRSLLSRRSYSAQAIVPTSQDPKNEPPSPPLPSNEERDRSPTSKRFTHLMDHLQSNLFTASRQLNDLTGYTSIEALKQQTESLESALKTSRARVHAARTAYQSAIAQRSASQREVNDLLQRKHAWNPPDLERFTQLYRSDHANEQAEAEAQGALAEAERAAEEVQQRLGRSMLERYHEEQIWSDKIRRMSTWGTWGLMAVNVLLFLVFQIGVEPWRRRRLVAGFEDKVREAMERQTGEMHRLSNARDGRAADGRAGGLGDESLAVLVAEVVPLQPDDRVAMGSEVEESPKMAEVEENISDASEDVSVPPRSQMVTAREKVQDLWSDRPISMRMLDATTIALEGALTGAALAGAIAFLVRRS